MVSDTELVERLREFLQTSDLSTTTTAIVRRKLEQDFGIDLSDKKVFIREQVDLFLQSQFDKAEEEGGEDEKEEEEAKPKTKSEESNSSDSEGDDESGDEEEEEEETGNGKGSRKKSRSNKLSKEVKKRGGGFTKLCTLSPQLKKFVGVPEMARTEVVKQLWVYIREKNLQDPNNKRNIMCDEKLRSLFGVDSINMFQMNKALSKHIGPLDTEDAPVKSTQKEKQRKQERKEDTNEPKQKEKRQKGGNSGFLAPLPLSGALVKFLGTGENSLSRASVVKRMWEYIKQNNLQTSEGFSRYHIREKKELSREHKGEKVLTSGGMGHCLVQLVLTSMKMDSSLESSHFMLKWESLGSI
ncbi:PREDICTED: upstream activation factor subunit spp27-like isoform X1 [Nelumbo nucifera]|uniref:Upstream activation factor subunit spp27-like isoform X1 n=1 Tax=Nelumbo nucifera TaxID=4432 RepID=A0A1U8Q694_NELNU|nr:PREDICTED: upstream activation factor subunit spp27-like isoform X1 [Nelumbo nucifera]